MLTQRVGVILNGYSRLHRITDTSAIILFAAFSSLLAWSTVASLDRLTAWIVLAISITIGYTLADLASGIAHWLADRYGTEKSPIVGSTFIRPFREHHLDPKAITHHDFTETNGSSCLVSVPFVAVAYLSFSEESSLFTTFMSGLTLAFCLAIVATNQFHKWAHMDRAGRLVIRLRKMSLILTPEQHDLHHTAPFEHHYCITTGWCNPLLERFAVFARVESLLAVLTGARPEHVLPSRGTARQMN